MITLFFISFLFGIWSLAVLFIWHWLWKQCKTDNDRYLAWHIALALSLIIAACFIGLFSIIESKNQEDIKTEIQWKGGDHAV